jgi:glycosyltransferase involved in cell wall biosynthesis
MGIIYPKITIITPTLNQAEYIEQCILSILDQGYPNLQYIVIDGGSTDGSVDIIKKYSDKIAYWVSEKDAGQSDAITKGILKSDGDIIHWVNSDDYMEPEALFKIAEAFKPGISCICAQSRIFGPEKELVSQTPWGTDFHTFSKSRIDQPATIFSADFMKNNLPDKNLHLAMDLDLWYRFLLSFPSSSIATISDLVINFREHENSKTMQLSQKMLFERASLSHELALGISIGKGRYVDLLHVIQSKRKTDILSGCVDFLFNAYRMLKKDNSKWANTLETQIKQLPLSWKHRITFYKIKTLGL